MQIFGRSFVKRFALCYRTVVCPVYPVCLSFLSVCDVGVLWPNSWTDQGQTWCAGRPRPSHIVLDGDRAPPKKGLSPPPQKKKVSAHDRCGQTAGWIKMPLDMEVGLGPADFVLDVDPAPFQQKGGTCSPRQFSAYVYCGQTAG